jgi:prophage regulatory protein
MKRSRQYLIEGEAMTYRFLRLMKVRHITGLSRSSIYGLIAKGRFPRQIHLYPSARSVGWLCAEVDEFVAKRIAER